MEDNEVPCRSFGFKEQTLKSIFWLGYYLVSRLIIYIANLTFFLCEALSDI